MDSLPESCRDLKSAIKYGRTSHALDDVLGALRSRELEIKNKKRGQMVKVQVNRGRTEKSDQSKGRDKSRCKSRSKKVSWTA